MLLISIRFILNEALFDACKGAKFFLMGSKISLSLTPFKGMDF